MNYWRSAHDPITTAHGPSELMMRRRLNALRTAALVQFALGLCCALCALVFWLAPDGHDELGLGPSLDFALGGAFAAAGVLFTAGGRRTWRAHSYWWLPGLLAIVAVPLVLVAGLLAS